MHGRTVTRQSLLVCAVVASAVVLAPVSTRCELSWRDIVVPQFSVAEGEDIQSALVRLGDAGREASSSNLIFSIQWFVSSSCKSGADIHAQDAPIGALAKSICNANDLACIETTNAVLVFEQRHWEDPGVFVCKGTLSTDQAARLPCRIKLSVQIGNEWRAAETILSDGRFIGVLPISETRLAMLVGKQEAVTIGVQRQLDEVKAIRVEAEGFTPFLHTYATPPKSPLQDLDVKLATKPGDKRR